MTMERKQFATVSSQALEFIDEHLGDLEHDDLDVDLAGDVLTLAFRDGGKFIVNAHSAAGQVWLAAGTSAWHFDYHPETSTWIAAKTGDELMHTVGRLVGDKLGISITL